MSLHLYICTQCCQAWHIHLQFKNIGNTMHAVWPAIDVVRRHYGVNHLHEPGRIIRTVWSFEIFSRLAIFAQLLLVESITASAALGVLLRRCKGMREYVRKSPPFPVSAGYGGGSRMRRYISIVSVRQVDFNI